MRLPKYESRLNDPRLERAAICLTAIEELLGDMRDKTPRLPRSECHSRAELADDIQAAVWNVECHACGPVRAATGHVG